MTKIVYARRWQINDRLLFSVPYAACFIRTRSSRSLGCIQLAKRGPECSYGRDVRSLTAVWLELQIFHPFDAFARHDMARVIAPVDDIPWAAFDLVEDQPYVFTNHAEKEKLYSTEKAQGGNQRRPTRNFNA